MSAESSSCKADLPQLEVSTVESEPSSIEASEQPSSLFSDDHCETSLQEVAKDFSDDESAVELIYKQEEKEVINSPDVENFEHHVNCPTNDWGSFDKKKRLFNGSPQALNKNNIQEFFRKCADLGADDIAFQGDNNAWCKLEGEYFRVTQRHLSVEEVKMVLIETHRDSAPGKVQSGEPVELATSVPYQTKDNRIHHFRFRGSGTACMGVNGGIEDLALVYRTMPAFPPTVEELGVPEQILEFAFPASGMIWVVGETGSGKTTMIGSFVRHLGTTGRGKHILTYEDPCEFDYRSIPNLNSLISQTHVGEMISSYDKAMPNALRRNPCVAVLGEVRGLESINSALLAAQSGHLVLATLHVDSVHQTPNRLLNDVPADEQQGKLNAIIDSTRGIIHQRLVMGKNGKRVAVQEWLEFTKEVRDELRRVNFKDVSEVIARFVDERGRSLLEDINSKKDLIDDEEYERQVRSIEIRGKENGS